MSNLNPRQFYEQHPEHAPASPVEEIERGARVYTQRHDIPAPLRDLPGQAYHSVMASEQGPAIGRAYQNLPAYDPRAEKSFGAFRGETGRQFEFLTGGRGRGGLGVNVETTERDPYSTPEEMRSDLREGRMRVLSTRATGGHPFLEDDYNDMFRAVHDAFGHAATGRGFDRHGEEAAWIKHSQMYSPEARPAMTSETRGQNSAFIFSLSGKQFPEQKVALLPEQYQDVTKTRFGQQVGRRQSSSNLLGRQFNI